VLQKGEGRVKATWGDGWAKGQLKAQRCRGDEATVEGDWCVLAPADPRLSISEHSRSILYAAQIHLGCASLILGSGRQCWVLDGGRCRGEG
jgi:hypothetical protein